MAKMIINLMVEGGKAVAGPTMGSALGPAGVPVGQVIGKVNEVTKEFAGMKVPVKVIVDPATKSFELEVGSPPVSALIKKELKLEKGTGDGSIVGDISFDTLVKIAKERQGKSFGKTLKDVVKEIVGTCSSMGISVEGKKANEFMSEIDGKDIA
ncbi:MAG: 50S ribosomal protein L11 [Candidatus Altiarchaeota archaeon]|nr:50S ribosomal protein L11 [Candidatus Altiarchaeota archaeon]